MKVSKHDITSGMGQVPGKASPFSFFQQYSHSTAEISSCKIQDGKANYAYLAIIIQFTNEDAPADGGFKGYKVVNVVHSVPCASDAAGLDWYKSEKYESSTGTGYYNPADGSITLVNVKGKKGGKEFCINRRYTPSEK